MSQNTNFIVGIGGEDLGTVIENFQAKSLKINMTESIAIGNLIPGGPSQGVNSIMIGNSAGITSSQGNFAIAIGDYAGRTTQGGNTVAIGTNAGLSSQGGNAIAIGFNAGSVTQLSDAIAIGRGAGQTSQQPGAITIGQGAGQSNPGTQSIAIGQNAGNNSLSPNSIQINATGSDISQTTSSTCVIAPIRSANPITTGDYSLPLLQNTTTKEVFTNTRRTVSILSVPNTPDNSYYNSFILLSSNIESSGIVNIPTPNVPFPATLDIFNNDTNAHTITCPAGTFIITNFAGTSNTFVMPAQSSLTLKNVDDTRWTIIGTGGNQTVNTINAYGRINTTNGILLNSATNFGTNDITFSNGTSSFTLQVNDTVSPNFLRFITGGTNSLVIATNANVGIRTTTPQHPLDINGYTRISGTLEIGGANNITLGSGATAPTVSQLGYSIKTNITSGTVSSLIATGTRGSVVIGNIGVYILTCNFVINCPVNNNANAFTNVFFGLTTNSFSNTITGSSIFIQSPVSGVATGFTTGVISCVYSNTSSSTTVYLQAVGSNFSALLPSVNSNTYITYIRIA